MTSLCLYTHLLAALIIPMQALLFALWWPRYRARWRAWLGALACLTLPYLPLAIWEVPMLFSAFETGHPFYPLRTMVLILFTGFSLGITGRITLTSGVLFIFILLAGVLLFPRRRSVATLLVWLLLPVIGVYLISLGMPIFTDRYLIYIVPSYCLILAAGLAALRQRSTIIFALCLIAVLTLNVRGLWAQTATPIKSDLRATARYFEARHELDDLAIFLIPYVRHTFEYYHTDDYTWADGPYTNGGMSEEEVGATLARMVEGHHRIWLIVSEAELWDARGLVRRWLEENARLLDEAHFARVTLYLYQADQADE